jgi:hypothetical protein
MDDTTQSSLELATELTIITPTPHIDLGYIGDHRHPSDSECRVGTGFSRRLWAQLCNYEKLDAHGMGT